MSRQHSRSTRPRCAHPYRRVLGMLCAGLMAASPGRAQDGQAQDAAGLAVARAREQVRAASPWSYRRAGTARYLGLTSPCTVTLASDGRMLLAVEGRAPFLRAWDGAQAWARDFADGPRHLHLREREEEIAMGMLLSGAWADAGGPGSPMQFGAARVTDDARVSLGFTIESTTEGRIVFDTQTGRPLRALWGIGEEAQVLEFTAWDDGKPPFPSSFRLHGRNSVVEITCEGARTPLSPADAGAFRLSAVTPDATFDATVDSELKVTRAKTGHLLVTPTINGREMGAFIFDTGAGVSVIDRAVAEQLGLAMFGSIPVGGVGGSLQAPLATAERFTLGPLTMRRSPLLVLDLAPIAAAMGTPIAGVIGYDVFDRSIVRLNTKEARISVHDPATFDATPHPFVPLMLFQRHPCVEATFEGKRGVFRLDSGAGALGVIFHAPTVTRHKLLEGRETEDFMTAGVGGSKATKRGTLASFILAGHEMTNFSAQFAIESEGAFGNADIAGTVGGAVLENYTILLDYARERIALEPRAATK